MNFLRLATFALFVAMAFAARAEEAGVSADDIRAILRQRIDVDQNSVGMVVGIVDQSGEQVVGYGYADHPGGVEVNGDTIYEIGSITKVFTSLLLQDMIERGEMKLDDPLARYLPASVKVPSRGGKEITFHDLITHRSSLPRDVGNLAPTDPLNPYGNLTTERMYSFLSGCTLPRDIGAKFEYSNMGVSLVGQAIALQAGQDYETLLLDRICHPLKMSDTRLTLGPEFQARVAQAHSRPDRPVPYLQFGDLPAAGAIRSTVRDLLKFAAAEVGLTPNPLAAAILKTHEIQTGSTGPKMAMGWFVSTELGRDFLWHSGGTIGCHSFVGLDLANKRGVVVLSNQRQFIDDIGFHLLDPQKKLAKVKRPLTRFAGKIDFDACSDYVGRYRVAEPPLDIDVCRDGDRFLARVTGEAEFELAPASQTEFFSPEIGVEFTFVKNAKGEIDEMVVLDAGLKVKAAKVEK